MQRTKRETIQSARSIDLIDIAFLRFQTKDKLFEPFLEKKKKEKERNLFKAVRLYDLRDSIIPLYENLPYDRICMIFKYFFCIRFFIRIYIDIIPRTFARNPSFNCKNIIMKRVNSHLYSCIFNSS